MMNQLLLLGVLAAISPAVLAAPAGNTLSSSAGDGSGGLHSTIARGSSGGDGATAGGSGATSTFAGPQPTTTAGKIDGTMSSSAAAPGPTSNQGSSGVQILSDPGQTYGAPPTLYGVDGVAYNLIGCYIDRPDEQGRGKL